MQYSVATNQTMVPPVIAIKRSPPGAVDQHQDRRNRNSESHHKIDTPLQIPPIRLQEIELAAHFAGFARAILCRGIVDGTALLPNAPRPRHREAIEKASLRRRGGKDRP
jgi:hypothetical protein